MALEDLFLAKGLCIFVAAARFTRRHQEYVILLMSWETDVGIKGCTWDCFPHWLEAKECRVDVGLPDHTFLPEGEATGPSGRGELHHLELHHHVTGVAQRCSSVWAKLFFFKKTEFVQTLEYHHATPSIWWHHFWMTSPLWGCHVDVQCLEAEFPPLANWPVAGKCPAKAGISPHPAGVW